MKVVAAVIRRGRSVLAAKRAETEPHPGEWEFPGGKVEAGESLETALARELEEELGVSGIGIERPLWETTYRYPGREPVELTFFLANGIRQDIRNLQFAELRWVPVGELHTLDFPGSGPRVPDRARRRARHASLSQTRKGHVKTPLAAREAAALAQKMLACARSARRELASGILRPASLRAARALGAPRGLPPRKSVGTIRDTR